jgi:hypothetical protein
MGRLSQERMTGKTFEQRVRDAKGLGLGVKRLFNKAVAISKRNGNSRRDGNASMKITPIIYTQRVKRRGL